MPNWTNNTWRISGDESAIKNFEEAALDLVNNIFDFNGLIPTPQELTDTISPNRVVSDEEYAQTAGNDASIIGASEAKRRIQEYGALDWYEFHNRHWGTKWSGPYLEILERQPGEITITFDTAWDLPRGILEFLRRQGLSVSGGAIHEDGSEFEDISLEDDPFGGHFRVISTVLTEDYDGETYSWTQREIKLKNSEPES